MPLDEETADHVRQKEFYIISGLLRPEGDG